MEMRKWFGLSVLLAVVVAISTSIIFGQAMAGQPVPDYITITGDPIPVAPIDSNYGGNTYSVHNKGHNTAIGTYGDLAGNNYTSAWYKTTAPTGSWKQYSMKAAA